MHSSILATKEVTVSSLKAILDQALIAAERDDDGDLYVTDGLEFPVWVRMDVERKLLISHTYVMIRHPERPVVMNETTLLSVINDLNKTYVVAQFHTVDQGLVANARLSFDGGLIPTVLVRTLQKFASVFAEATRDERVVTLLTSDARAPN